MNLIFWKKEKVEKSVYDKMLERGISFQTLVDEFIKPCALDRLEHEIPDDDLANYLTPFCRTDFDGFKVGFNNKTRRTLIDLIFRALGNYELVPTNDEIVRFASFEHDKFQKILADDLTRLCEKLKSKNGDYGCSVYKTPLLSRSTNVVDSILVRTSDKLERIFNLESGTSEPKNESLSDSYLDLAGYAALLFGAVLINNRD